MIVTVRLRLGLKVTVPKSDEIGEEREEAGVLKTARIMESEEGNGSFPDALLSDTEFWLNLGIGGMEKT